jgi:transcriptional regulator with XRE-family HTH domain
MKIDAKKLSDLLRGLMGDNNAAEMARRMGVNAQTLRAYVRGDINNPTKEFMYEIACYMNVDLESLMEQLSVQSSPMVASESTVLYYLTASDAIPVLKKMPPKEKLKVAKYLIDDAV